MNAGRGGSCRNGVTEKSQKACNTQAHERTAAGATSTQSSVSEAVSVDASEAGVMRVPVLCISNRVLNMN